MSVIYRSLQQLKDQEVEQGARQTPQAVAPRMSRLLLRAGLMLLVFVVLVGAGVYFVQQEVQTVPLPPQPDEVVASGPRQVGQTPVQEQLQDPEDVAAIVAEKARLTAPQEEPQVPIVRQRLIRDVESKEPPIDMTKPTKALESYFQKRARKNENVLALERSLVQASNKGDLSKSKQLITSMSREMGKRESATKYKWEGYLALKEKRYADAENFFRRAVGIRSTDYVSNINLVYSLLGQQKRDEAILVYRKLIDRYPMNEKVLKLGKSLGEM